MQWKIAINLGWVPPKADREATYDHLNKHVPDFIKFDLHVLLVRYGKEVRHASTPASGDLSVFKSSLIRKQTHSLEYGDLLICEHGEWVAVIKCYHCSERML